MTRRYAIRLVEAPDPTNGTIAADPAAIFPDHDLIGFSDIAVAWRFAVAVILRDTKAGFVAVPGDLGAAAHAAIAAAGARTVAADLEPDTARVVWADVPLEMSIVEHRLGVVRTPPRLAEGAHRPAIVHDLTDVVGAHAGVFAREDVGLLRLGQPPFWRSYGAVVLVPRDSAAPAAKVTATVRGIDPTPSEDWDADRRRRFREDLGDALDWIEACRAAADVYRSAFRPLNALIRCLPEVSIEPHPSFTSFHVLVADPDGLRDRLRDWDVETERPAPGPLARPTAGLPSTSGLYRRALRLPNHANLGMGELLYVADAIRGYLEGRPGPR
ncbi:MAG: hypothetical protein FJX78_07235 [Armatimonadetes bacterium]|nr:hypothetical protein [Armatimonadota bacterium]